MRHVLLFRWLRTLLVGLPEPSLTQKNEIGRRVPVQQYRENFENLIEQVRNKGAKPVWVSVCNFAEYQEIKKLHSLISLQHWNLFYLLCTIAFPINW